MLECLEAPDGLGPEADRLDGFPHPREMLSLIGHQRAEHELLDSLRSGRMPHAWLFAGEEGIGKATLAYRFARFMLAGGKPDTGSLDVPRDSVVAHQVASGGHPDLAAMTREINPNTKNFFTEIRVDDVRKGLDLFTKTAAAGGYRIAIVDSCDELNASSANALLKKLEEPPSNSLFLLVVHRLGAILPTIRSRCRVLNLQLLSEAEIIEGLQHFPKLQATADDISAAARLASGSMRRALTLCEPKRLAFARHVEKALDELPDTAAGVIDAIAENTMGRAGDEAFETFVSLAEQWMSPQLAGARAAQIAEAWAEMTDRRRAVDGLNLDRRPFVVGTFAALRRAML